MQFVLENDILEGEKMKFILFWGLDKPMLFILLNVQI